MEDVQAYEKKQRRKVIIVSVAMGVIVLGLVVWAIVATVSSHNTNDDTQPIVATEDALPAEANGATTDSQSAAGSFTEGETIVIEETGVSGAAVNTTPNTAADLPTTGPADYLPTALLMAAAVVLFLYNRQLARAEV